MARILVTGGTGVLGRHVARRLSEAGAEVRILTRRPDADVPHGETVLGELATGTGLGDAVAGTDAIVHCASATGTLRYAKARLVDVDGTRRLVAAAQASGAPRLVFISIVGIEKIPLGYYRAKREAEDVVAASRLAYTIQRTTQFHDLVYDTLQRAGRLPVLVVPKRFRFQPVDADEVAALLVSHLESEPAGRAPDMGGPQVRAIEDLALAYLTAQGRRKPVVSLYTPGKVARTFREGHNLAPEHTDGTVGWEDYLAARTAEA